MKSDKRNNSGREGQKQHIEDEELFLVLFPIILQFIISFHPPSSTLWFLLRFGVIFRFPQWFPGNSSEHPQARIGLWLLHVCTICRLGIKPLISSDMDMVGSGRPAEFSGLVELMLGILFCFPHNQSWFVLLLFKVSSRFITGVCKVGS